MADVSEMGTWRGDAIREVAFVVFVLVCLNTRLLLFIILDELDGNVVLK